jgi:DNA processing protein
VTGSPVPAAAFAAVLAGLPGIGPVGLADLVRRHDPETAWKLVQAGEIRRPDARGASPGGRGRPAWAPAAGRLDVGASWRRLRDRGIGVTFLGDVAYPIALRDDPQPPGVLFWVGDLAALERRCVAIVGTRRCTSYGRRAAFELGRDLARAGVAVVSGLALGIDGAAHAGVLADATDRATGGWAGPVGIAASGVDQPYPRQHIGLWAKVAANGLILSETPPGQPAQAWRFPARNRIIAGLSQVVIVVESHAAGGSMHTVDAALDRGIEVRAVPGPVTSSSSAGTNQLLWDGPGPVRHAGDVLDILGEIRPWPPVEAHQDRRATMPGLDRPTRRVLDAVDRTPTPTSVIAERTGLPIGPLSTTLLRLEGLGLVRGEGGWWERGGRR